MSLEYLTQGRISLVLNFSAFEEFLTRRHLGKTSKLKLEQKFKETHTSSPSDE